MMDFPKLSRKYKLLFLSVCNLMILFMLHSCRGYEGVGQIFYSGTDQDSTFFTSTYFDRPRSYSMNLYLPNHNIFLLGRLSVNSESLTFTPESQFIINDSLERIQISSDSPTSFLSLPRIFIKKKNELVDKTDYTPVAEELDSMSYKPPRRLKIISRSGYFTLDKIYKQRYKQTENRAKQKKERR